MPGSIVGYINIISNRLRRVNLAAISIPTNKPKAEAFRASEGLNASRIQVIGTIMQLSMGHVKSSMANRLDNLVFSPVSYNANTSTGSHRWGHRDTVCQKAEWRISSIYCYSSGETNSMERGKEKPRPANGESLSESRGKKIKIRKDFKR